MKIGILTYQRAHNYGALLQAYSLQTYLKKHGHEVDIIDYWPEYHAQDYKLIPYFKNRSFLGKIKAILILLIGYKRIIKRTNGYEKFIREQFNLSETVNFTTEESLNEIEYDVVVYGSDQIWRRSNYSLFKGFSDVYFGAFPKKVKHKITYAASMGVIDVNDDDKVYLKKMLQNFDVISVREDELKKLAEEIIGHNVTLVLDPVFLLTRKEWMKLNNPLKMINKKEKYIFFYQLTPSDEAIDFVNNLSDYYGYKVFEIRGRVEPLLFGNRYLQTASPIDFLSLINNAELVVSTSFHGVAFSLIFEKQFYALGMGNNSGRVQTLLDNLNISERLLTNDTKIDFEKKINYDNLKVRMAELKSQSENYILENIGND